MTATAPVQLPASLDAALAALEEAGHALGSARAWEMQLEDLRALVKRDAIERILQTENPLTHKPHSASSAEAIVESDVDYTLHRLNQRVAVIDVDTARGRFEAAKLRAYYAAQVDAATLTTEDR